MPGPHSIFEGWLHFPAPPCFTHACAVCVGCMHACACVLAHLTPPGPCSLPSTQEKRSWQMTNSHKTCSGSCSCSVRVTTMVRRRGGRGGEDFGVWGCLELLPEFISNRPPPLIHMAASGIRGLSSLSVPTFQNLSGISGILATFSSSGQCNSPKTICPNPVWPQVNLAK
jgi:hypothetical protein